MGSYISPKVKVSYSKTSGKGLMATDQISKDEVIVDYSKGMGEYVNSGKADNLFNRGYDHMIQVDDDLFFAAIDESQFESADFVNHSCDPNAGVHDKLQLVALRNIVPGEEITFDYAMSESSEYKIKCNCGAKNCRGLITGDDWKHKDLQEKYKNYFSQYLLEKIKKTA